jgi:hypothetical protein
MWRVVSSPPGKRVADTVHQSDGVEVRQVFSQLPAGLVQRRSPQFHRVNSVLSRFLFFMFIYLCRFTVLWNHSIGSIWGIKKLQVRFMSFVCVGDFIEVYNELGNGSGTNTTSAAISAANTTSAATGASAASAATKDSSTEASGSAESRSASRKATKLHLC